ncbi:zinc finger protein 628-like [Penaeus monodon]|uniref:zinc finger protein 628-like n=1 Tax=Penaeus monodon TaxID=6687 RepID=UPI0018A6FDD5|nr:zinc finger protein 628-like [Penaeus monodon]
MGIIIFFSHFLLTQSDKQMGFHPLQTLVVEGFRWCHSLQGGGRSGKLGGGEAEALACSVCGKLITGRNRRQRLQYHLSTHSGERPHHCPFCPYRAHHKFTLDRHVRTVHRDHFVLRDAPSTHGVAQTLPSSTVSEGAPPSMGPSITMSGLARLMEDTQGVADHT